VPDIDFAFLADAADARPGQKFAVLGGGVSRVGGPTFPLRHPHLALVVGMVVTAAEMNVEHELRFVLLSPDGAELSSGAARIKAAGPGDGRDTVISFAIDLWNLTFAAPGDYSFRILVGNSERKRLPLVVERRDVPPGEPGASGGGSAEPGSSGPLPPFPPPAGQA
jgi:hypothetical protein